MATGQRAKRPNSEHLPEQPKRSKDLNTSTMDAETLTMPRPNQQQCPPHMVTPGQEAVPDAAKNAKAKAQEIQSPAQPAAVDEAKTPQAKPQEVQSPAQTATATPDRVDETELWERPEAWPTFLQLDKTKPATRKWAKAHQTGKFHPLSQADMNLADKLPALKSVVAGMCQQKAFLEACGVNTKAPDFDLPKAIKAFEMHHIPHTMIALMVSEAFEGGNHFNGNSFFPDKKSKSKTCQFMIHLTMTAFDLSECYDQALGGWKNPSVRDALHHALSEYFGPVALSYNAPPKPKAPKPQKATCGQSESLHQHEERQSNRQSPDSGDCGGSDTNPLPSDSGARPTPTTGIGGNSL